MFIAPKDRRGLGEIVSISCMTVSLSAVLVAEIARGMTPDGHLVAALIALVMIVAGRGVQSATERSAATDLRNQESREMAAAVAELRREIEAQRSVTRDLVEQKIVGLLESKQPPAPQVPGGKTEP